MGQRARRKQQPRPVGRRTHTHLQNPACLLTPCTPVCASTRPLPAGTAAATHPPAPAALQCQCTRSPDPACARKPRSPGPACA
eukprot:21284-Chlamydomonas_euryale.AAC.1